MSRVLFAKVLFIIRREQNGIFNATLCIRTLTVYPACYYIFVAFNLFSFLYLVGKSGSNYYRPDYKNVQKLSTPRDFLIFLRQKKGFHLYTLFVMIRGIDEQVLDNLLTSSALHYKHTYKRQLFEKSPIIKLKN